ncbi:hypothetical protein SBC1_74350 (plasmid) [Caballeronia sp. SBC1]|nr:hypothetical protein SBC2_71940 [Caballeronia sp. SBC2]QIN67388.1 hypothetical protein SBC1_74350 [Caballeronia sp. SBC1]
MRCCRWRNYDVLDVVAGVTGLRTKAATFLARFNEVFGNQKPCRTGRMIVR